MWTGVCCHVSPPSVLRERNTLRFSDRPPSWVSQAMWKKYRVLSWPMATNDIGMSPLSWVQNGKAAGDGTSLPLAHVRPPSTDRRSTHCWERTSTAPA